ncbi:hypothetical protein ACRYCC_14995 [Actinomadura scrupuli]|uniref:hypothetical protein n=1 Tax=Actinomadura scrupuli TaxID=559629 RepID=UPI003D95477D
MEKNWSWGHSDPDTDRKTDTDPDTGRVVTEEEPPAAEDDDSRLSSDEARTDTDTDTDTDADADAVPSGHVEEVHEDLHVAGTPGDRDEVLVPPAPEDDTTADTTGSDHVSDDHVSDDEVSDDEVSDDEVSDHDVSDDASDHVSDDPERVSAGAAEPAEPGYGDDLVEPGTAAREPGEPAETAEPAGFTEAAGDTPAAGDAAVSDDTASENAVSEGTSEAEGTSATEAAVVAAGATGTAAEAAGERPPASDDAKGDRIEQLMGQEEAAAFRVRWREVQSDFVDDPEDAVRRADELASEVLSALIESLNGHKRTLDDRWRADTNKSDTERLRQAVRGYRDFFERMLGA